jgi:hypothetical protein
MPLMRSSFYATSALAALRQMNSGTDDVCVVVPSEQVIVDTCTAPISDDLFSLSSSASTACGPLFMFDDIDNALMLLHRKSDAYSSSFIFVDANCYSAEHQEVVFCVPRILV